jgi:hypothetical protein
MCINHNPTTKLMPATTSLTSIASAVSSRPGKKLSIVQYQKNANDTLPINHPAKRGGFLGAFNGPIFMEGVDSFMAGSVAKEVGDNQLE